MTRPAPEVVLRRTAAGDLDRVLEIETAPDTVEWLGESSRHWHAGALEDPDREHLVVVDRSAVGGGAVAGFVVLAAPRGTEYGVELRRIVIAPEHRGRGLGRAALRAAVDRAFATAGRVWLDVKPGNARALALYASEGFLREQELPASPGDPDGAVALVILARHRG